jgi:hypothetical protein|tara:strand:+ start:1713 stop:2384 length:672 start_codon:yes stop_codon:yes gene_type:complete
MSLINQALRKAQQQRTPSRPATAADHASASPTNYRGNSNQSGLLIGLVAGIALLIGLVAGLTIVVLRKDPAPVTQQAATLPAPVKQIAPATPVFQPLAPPTPAPTQPLEQGSPSVLNDLRLARVAAEAKAAADATSAKQVEAAKQLAATKAAAKPSQDIIQWLGKSKISGVRLSTSGNKVILNNKAYSVGETVNLGLGLKVLIIQEKRILFIDPNGKKYLKQV